MKKMVSTKLRKGSCVMRGRRRIVWGLLLFFFIAFLWGAGGFGPVFSENVQPEDSPSLEGEVEAEADELDITARRITIDRMQDLLEAEGDVQITRGSLQLSGDYAKLNRNQEYLLVRGSVYLIEDEDFELLTDELESFLEQDHHIARGNVELTFGELWGKAEHLDYRRDEGVMVLTGAPEVGQNGDRLTAEEITIYRADERVVAEGEPRIRIH